MAMSLGGYYTPAHRGDGPALPGVHAGVLPGTITPRGPRLEKIKEAALPVPADHLLWACGVERTRRPWKIEGFRSTVSLDHVHCPFLLMHGAEDAQVSTAEAQKLFDAIGAKDKSFRVFTAEEGGAQHCQRDYLTRAIDVCRLAG